MKTLIPIYAFLFALIGCHAHIKPVDPTGQLTEHVTGAKSEVVAAKGSLKAKDFTATDKHLDGAVVHLDAETVVIAAVAKDSLKTQQALADAQASIAKHANDWFGPRAHRWFWGLFWTGLVVSIVMGVLRGVFPASAFIQFISPIFMGVFSFGASIVHALAKWVGGKFAKATPAAAKS